MKVKILKSRLKEFDTLELAKGSHSPDHTFCVMEAVAYVANEPWSDAPTCACPVLTAFMVSWNDALNDTDRQILKPYIPKLVGTRSTPEVEARRGRMCSDWLVRTYTPAWLRLAGLHDHADALASLPDLVTLDLKQIKTQVEPQVSAAYSAAVSAAYSAALDSAADSAAFSPAYAALDSAADSAALSAAYSAARSAADSAADSAARSAAYSALDSAAYSAARSAADSALDSAAYSAARSAADSAARSAARSALQPVVADLQAKAFVLLDRLLAVTPETVSA